MKRNINVLMRDIGDKTLLVPLGKQVMDMNGFVILNKTGRYIWGLLAHDPSMDDVAIAVADRFKVDISIARADVQAFMDGLSDTVMRGTTNTISPNFATLARDLHQQAALYRQPVNGTFELTNRCNLACRMCYVRHPAGDRQHSTQELPASAWLELARKAVDSGMVFLLLTGGEVFLRSDFFDIYEPLTRLGLILSIYSNGTLITEDIARRLAQAPPNSIEITLYGATADTYEAVSGVSGSYARCCAGIETLLAYHIPLGIKTTITRHNVDELEAMRQMAHNWGLPFESGWLLSKRRDGSPSDVENCRISASDCAALEATGRATAVEGTEATLRELPNISNGNFYCLAGKAAFVVTPSGMMNVCIDLPMPGKRPLETSFHSAWKQLQQFVDSAPSAAIDCLNCCDRDFCPRCPAWSSLETNTLTEPVPYLCDIARARKDHYASKK